MAVPQRVGWAADMTIAELLERSVAQVFDREAEAERTDPCTEGGAVAIADGAGTFQGVDARQGRLQAIERGAALVPGKHALQGMRQDRRALIGLHPDRLP